MRRPVSTWVPHACRLVGVGIVVAASVAGLSLTLRAQEPNAGRPASAAGADTDTTADQGPAFYTVRQSDGEHLDARGAPPLQRRISLTLVGTPLGTASRRSPRGSLPLEADSSGALAGYGDRPQRGRPRSGNTARTARGRGNILPGRTVRDRRHLLARPPGSLSSDGAHSLGDLCDFA